MEQKELLLNWLEKQRRIRNDTEIVDGLISQLKKELSSKPQNNKKGFRISYGYTRGKEALSRLRSRN